MEASNMVKSKSSVSADELNALKGCVSRHRAIFSPTTSVDTAQIHLGEMRTGTWPDLITSCDNAHSERDRSLSTFDGSNADSPQSHGPVSLPYSVSVQFGSVAHSAKKDLENCQQKQTVVESMPVLREGKHPASISIPGRLNSLNNWKSFQKVGDSTTSHFYIGTPIHSRKADYGSKQNHLRIPVVRTKSLDEELATSVTSANGLFPDLQCLKKSNSKPSVVVLQFMYMYMYILHCVVFNICTCTCSRG